MKLRFFIIPGVVALAFGCADRRAPAAGASADLSSMPAPSLAQIIARHAVIGGDPPMTPIGGYVSINDEQMSNRHGANATFYRGNVNTQQCTETLFDEDGLKCVTTKYCGPPPGGDTDGGVMPPPDNDDPLPGSSGDAGTGGYVGPIAVGNVEITAAYDRLVLEANPYYGGYNSISRQGPFWNGDGDFVTLSIEGKPGVAPALVRKLPAPVPDAMARIPATANRTAPLTIEWTYAEGSGTATGYMTIYLQQYNAAPAGGEGGYPADILCGTTASKHGMHIPPAVLARFSTGPAYVSMNSAIEEKVISEGVFQFNINLSASVNVESTGTPGGDPLPTFGSSIMFQ